MGTTDSPGEYNWKVHWRNLNMGQPYTGASPSEVIKDDYPDRIRSEREERELENEKVQTRPSSVYLAMDRALPKGPTIKEWVKAMDAPVPTRPSWTPRDDVPPMVTVPTVTMTRPEYEELQRRAGGYHEFKAKQEEWNRQNLIRMEQIANIMLNQKKLIEEQEARLREIATAFNCPKCGSKVCAAHPRGK